MIILVIYVTLILITHTHSLRTELRYNRTVRRKTEYRVNISMPDNDIEMADSDEFIQFGNIPVKIGKRHKENTDRTSQTRSPVGIYNNTTLYPKITKLTQNISQVGLTSSRDCFNNSLTNSSYGDTKSKEKSDETYHTVEIDAEKIDLKEQANPPRTVREISADRIWNIVQIWLTVYFVLAIPLWCTIGRCCCCLVCKCFKAHETIREAKQYAMWNPPGVLRKKSGDVFYAPSEKEREAYEELEHLIRTL